MSYLHLDMTGFQSLDIDLKSPTSPFYAKFSELDEKTQDCFALCAPSDDIPITLSSSDDSPVTSPRSSFLSSAGKSDDEDFVELFNQKTSLSDSQRFECHATKTLEDDIDCTPTIIEFEDGSLQHSQTYGSGFPMTRTIQKSSPAFSIFGGCSSKAFEEQVDDLLAPKEPIQVMVEVEVLVHSDAGWGETDKRALHQKQSHGKRNAIYVKN